MIEPLRRVAALLPALSLTCALCTGALLAGCSTPRGAIAELGELYARPPEAAAEPDETVAEYVAEVEDPVALALEQLACVAEGDEDDLDPGERVAAVATLAEMARRDRSRIVRARALEVLQRSLVWLPAPWRAATTAAVDEQELTRALEPLLALAAQAPEAIAAELAGAAPALVESAHALAAVQPESFSLTLRLTRLAAKTVRRARDGGADELVVALDVAGAALARHLAFLVARADGRFGRGLLDPAGEVRAAAGAVLLEVDPIAATVELGRAWSPGVPALVRVAWLQQLRRAPLVGANVHPTLRAVLVQELQSDDAAIGYAARGAVAHLLGRAADGAKVVELKAAWLALGEWQAAPLAGRSGG